MTIKMIISGGQTGADQGGLEAAKELGIPTGGWMPKGFRTAEGDRPDFQELYSMFQHKSREYPPRTRENVAWAEGTLIFGNQDSAGCRLTLRYCREFGRQIYVQKWSHRAIRQFHADPFDTPEELGARFRLWLETSGIKTLNVAGNREQGNPGIFLATRDFLISALRKDVGVMG